MNNRLQLAGRHLVVVGAGLVGTLCSLHLVRRGARVTLLEKRPDMRRADIPGGRSIAMSLSERGWHALRTVGMDQAVRDGAMPKRKRCVHLSDGSVQEQAYGRPEHALWTVNRKTLNSVLLDAAEKASVDLRFDTLCEDVDLATGRLAARHQTTGTVETLDCDHLLGADGMNSQVRKDFCRAGYIGDEMLTLDYRYFEFVIPPADDGEFRLDPDGVHIWPRPEGLFVALPNQDASFTGTLFFAKKGDNLFRYGRAHEERVRGFVEAFPDLARLCPDYDETLERNPPSDIKAVRCSRWHVDGRVGLIGDACHAIVPFFAMGMNTGFEDVTTLDDLIEEFDGDMDLVLPAFSERRKPCTDAIGDLSLANFQSIGRSADPDYDRRWHLERRLWDLMPDQWTPLYPMIHFGRRPLDEVIAASRAQSAVLDELMTGAAVDADDETLVARAAELLGRTVKHTE
ncbi:MAG: FAD-dependent monooxygenase [bacterium]|nr:FAD-dependent monooxygenase [bacterium]